MFVASPSFFDGYYSTLSAFANQEKTRDPPSLSILFVDAVCGERCQNGSFCGWGLILQVL
jgi:hypothetical protein